MSDSNLALDFIIVIYYNIITYKILLYIVYIYIYIYIYIYYRWDQNVVDLVKCQEFSSHCSCGHRTLLE